MLENFFINGEGEIINALKELYWLSVHQPSEIFRIMLLSANKNKFSLIPLGMAIIFSKSSEKDLLSFSDTIERILLRLNAEEMFNLVEYLKNKDFGRGLGARPQKLVRKCMERWGLEEITGYASTSPRSLYRLIRLIHPSYNDARGLVVKKLMRENSGK